MRCGKISIVVLVGSIFGLAMNQAWTREMTCYIGTYTGPRPGSDRNGAHTPRGVAGRNSDNTFIKKMLKWEPSTSLDTGLKATYQWIKQQYEKRKQGRRVVE